MTQNATINTLIQQVVPDELRGRVMAVYTLMFFGTAPFARAAGGRPGPGLGPQVGVAVGAVITPASLLLGVIVFVPSLRRLNL